MSAIEDKIRKMGFTLPATFKFPNPNRTGCVVVGPMVFVSGHGRDLPALPGVKHSGKVGKDVTIEEGYATSRAVALSILASLKAELGDLDRVKRLVRLFGETDCRPGMLAHFRSKQLVEEIGCSIDDLRHAIEAGRRVDHAEQPH